MYVVSVGQFKCGTVCHSLGLTNHAIWEYASAIREGKTLMEKLVIKHFQVGALF